MPTPATVTVDAATTAPGFTEVCPIGVAAGSASAAEGIRAHVIGEPRWADPQIAKIAGELDHEQALIEAFQRQGPDLLHDLQGHFALGVVDAAKGRALLATDRLGIRPLFYAEASGQLVFSTRADEVARQLATSTPLLSHQALYDYLYFEMIPGPDAVFEGVRRLLPGECLWLESRQIEVRSYGKIHYAPLRTPPPDAELQAQFLGIVRRSVADAAAEGRAIGRVGAFLSGGTDSSTVSGMLARASDEPVDTFSIGFDAPGYDEMEYARLVSRYFGTRNHEYYVTPQDVVDAVPRIAAFMDQPFGNASVVPAWYCARMAREQGIECLLAGDGGDELFGGNERYAKQKMFEVYGRIPRILRSMVVEPALENALAARLPGVRKLRSYVNQARIPMPQRMHTYNLLERLGGLELLTEGWRTRVDPDRPMALIESAYLGADAQDMLNRMLAVDMRFTIADSDIPKVNAACDLAGMAVRYPWLDQRLVDFAATLPVDQKVRGRRLRHLFKEALKDFLPPEVIAKRKHGFGLPFGLWLHEHQGLRDLAGDSLNGLKARGILRGEFIDRLLQEHHQTHAAYYGTFVWTLMMLEQWLAAHQTRSENEPFSETQNHSG